MTAVQSKIYELILPWWLRDGVRPEPEAPLHIPGLGDPLSEPVHEKAAKPSPAVGFDRKAFAAAMAGAGHQAKYAGGTATRAERLFRLVPEAVGGAVPDEGHPALAGITANSLKKIFQAVRMAQAWMRGEGVPLPKPAMGGASRQGRLIPCRRRAGVIHQCWGKSC